MKEREGGGALSAETCDSVYVYSKHLVGACTFFLSHDLYTGEVCASAYREIFRKMGVLLVSDGTAAVQNRMSLNAVKVAGAQRAIDVGNETNNNVDGLRDANSLIPTQVVGIIDVVVNDEPVRSWMPPPPKKKWIRHYLLGELIFLSTLFIAGDW